jgi:hypothetical protein
VPWPCSLFIPSRLLGLLRTLRRLRTFTASLGVRGCEFASVGGRSSLLSFWVDCARFGFPLIADVMSDCELGRGELGFEDFLLGGCLCGCCVGFDLLLTWSFDGFLVGLAQFLQWFCEGEDRLRQGLRRRIE